MTNPLEVFEDKLDKPVLERFELWLESLEEETDKADKEIVGLFRGATTLTKKKAIEKAKEKGLDGIAHKVEAILAVDIMNQSIYARSALANEFEKGKLG
jgi:hypothetical protein